MRIFFLSMLAITLLMQSCKKDGVHSKEPELKLEYSPSPIALDGINAFFSKDISYGPDPQNTFDIFLPQSNTSTPLVIYIHGGGFLGGEKENPYSMMWNGSWAFPEEIRTLLRNEIAFATINYRLLAFEGDQDGVLKSLNDSKRALQYIRSIHKTLNVDKRNIVLCGSSAGGGTSQWLAFSDDMADPQSTNPVLRESTRVKGVAVKATQASYDLQRYVTDIFTEYDFTWQWFFEEDPDMIPRFNSFYGMNDTTEFNSPHIQQYRSQVDMLSMMSADDPEFWVSNPQTPVVKPVKSNILNHHSFHARTLKHWADSLGVKNQVSYGYYQDPQGETFVDFMIRKTRE